VEGGGVEGGRGRGGGGRRRGQTNLGQYSGDNLNMNLLYKSWKKQLKLERNEKEGIADSSISIMRRMSITSRRHSRQTNLRSDRQSTTPRWASSTTRDKIGRSLVTLTKKKQKTAPLRKLIGLPERRRNQTPEIIV
jgi:hypothetical protein